MRVRRLDHFGVDVADLARAERFYTDVLGMRVRMRLADQVLLDYGDGSCALFFKPDRTPGGLDSVGGTITAALLLGVLEALAASYLDPHVGGGFSTIASYLVLVATLFVRPYGLFGRADAARV